MVCRQLSRKLIVLSCSRFRDGMYTPTPDVDGEDGGIRGQRRGDDGRGLWKRRRV